MDAETEVAIASLTRRRGIFYMLRLHWGVVFDEEDGFTKGCLSILFSYNYPAFIAIGAYGLGFLLPVTDLAGPAAWLGVIWLVTLTFGSLKYIAWLFSLLNRWPPLSGA